MKSTFLIILFIYSSILLTSCVYKIGGAEVYSVTSETEQGKKDIEKYKIQYVSPSTIAFFWTDVQRAEGGFAYDVREVDGKLVYQQLDKKYAEANQLKPSFSFWQEYGRYIIVPITVIIGLFIAISKFAN